MAVLSVTVLFIGALLGWSVAAPSDRKCFQYNVEHFEILLFVKGEIEKGKVKNTCQLEEMN